MEQVIAELSKPIFGICTRISPMGDLVVTTYSLDPNATPPITVAVELYPMNAVTE
jgi:hypothetical protein